MTKLIERNTTIPTNARRSSPRPTTPAARFRSQVFQGERESAYNKKLAMFRARPGCCRLPRGVPQIEVSFDIDANGIVYVSAKDLSTDRIQAMQIIGGSALGKDEIDRMMRDAERHAVAEHGPTTGRSGGASAVALRRRPGPRATGVFVNYRTADTAGTAGRLVPN